jgi:preprotein translocase subunit SecF/SecD/SecF fusion protein
VIRNFSFAMLFGIVIGTYSSIFIAAPLLGYLGIKRDTVGHAVKTKEPAGAKAKT